MVFSVYDDNIFPFFREFNVYSIENCKFYLKSWTLQRMSLMTKHVSKAGKVDLSDRVTLPVKFACKQALTEPTSSDSHRGHYLESMVILSSYNQRD